MKLYHLNKMISKRSCLRISTSWKSCSIGWIDGGRFLATLVFFILVWLVKSIRKTLSVEFLMTILTKSNVYNALWTSNLTDVTL